LGETPRHPVRADIPDQRKLVENTIGSSRALPRLHRRRDDEFTILRLLEVQNCNCPHTEGTPQRPVPTERSSTSRELSAGQPFGWMIAGRLGTFRCCGLVSITHDAGLDTETQHPRRPDSPAPTPLPTKSTHAAKPSRTAAAAHHECANPLTRSQQAARPERSKRLCRVISSWQHGNSTLLLLSSATCRLA